MLNPPQGTDQQGCGVIRPVAVNGGYGNRSGNPGICYNHRWVRNTD